MRIRKLAVELGVDPTLLLGWVKGLGYRRYDDVEQQIPADVVIRVKAWQRELPRQLWTAPSPVPVQLPAVALPVEAELLQTALKGVTRLDRGEQKQRPAAQKRPAAQHRPVPQKHPAPAQAPVAPPIVAIHPVAPTRGGSAVAPVPIAVESRRRTAETEALQAELKATQDAATALASGRAEQAAELLTLRKHVASLEDALLRVRAANEEANAAREALAAELADVRNTTAGHTGLQAVMERRGLLGSDEVSMALKSLLENRRDRDILPYLGTTAPDALLEVLNRRLVLLSEGDEVPEGVGIVWVSSERSEGDPPSAVRDALRRFTTACLLNNLKNIVIVGGSPTYHRVLRQGIDSRLRLRLVPGDARGRVPEVPSADLVIVWAASILDHRVSSAFPNAEIIPARGVARMLNLAADRIEGRAA